MRTRVERNHFIQKEENKAMVDLNICFHKGNQPLISRRYRFGSVLKLPWVEKLIEVEGAVSVGGGPFYSKEEEKFLEGDTRSSVWLVVNDNWKVPINSFPEQVNVWQAKDNI